MFVHPGDDAVDGADGVVEHARLDLDIVAVESCEEHPEEEVDVAVGSVPTTYRAGGQEEVGRARRR